MGYKQKSIRAILLMLVMVTWAGNSWACITHYDSQGHLIAETPNGAPQTTREYIYLGDQPIAVLQ